MTGRLWRGLLSAGQWACLTLAHLGHRSRRMDRRFAVRNLLKASRIARHLRDGDTVLDVGCGSGHVLAELRLFRDIRAIGVDLATVRVAFPDLEITTFDGRTLPFADASVDVVLLCYVLHHLSPDDAAALLREAIRVGRRRLVLIEDSLPEFPRLFRWRNRLHRLEAGLAYASESSRHVAARDEAMFLTHDGWRSWLAGFGRVGRVTIESFADVMRWRHHTLIEVELEPPPEATTP